MSVVTTRYIVGKATPYIARGWGVANLQPHLRITIRLTQLVSEIYGVFYLTLFQISCIIDM